MFSGVGGSFATDPGSACMGTGQFMLDQSYFAYRPTIAAGVLELWRGHPDLKNYQKYDMVT